MNAFRTVFAALFLGLLTCFVTGCGGSKDKMQGPAMNEGKMNDGKMMDGKMMDDGKKMDGKMMDEKKMN